MLIMTLRAALAHFIRVVHLLLSQLLSRSTCTCIVPLILFDSGSSSASQGPLLTSTHNCLLRRRAKGKRRFLGPLHTVPQTAFPRPRQGSFAPCYLSPRQGPPSLCNFLLIQDV